ncbi:MAG: hypothetical protein WD041_02425, partial [Nitriliruptoraceae bacterium]
ELVSRGRSVADTTLISDGTTVYAMTDDREMLDLLRRGQGVFAISLDPLVEELRGEVAAFPTEQVDATAVTAQGAPDADVIEAVR